VHTRSGAMEEENAGFAACNLQPFGIWPAASRLGWFSHGGGRFEHGTASGFALQPMSISSVLVCSIQAFSDGRFMSSPVDAKDRFD
jgi:hypothetical protein